jgi:hypothetical protein
MGENFEAGFGGGLATLPEAEPEQPKRLESFEEFNIHEGDRIIDGNGVVHAVTERVDSPNNPARGYMLVDRIEMSDAIKPHDTFPYQNLIKNQEDVVYIDRSPIPGGVPMRSWSAAVERALYQIQQQLEDPRLEDQKDTLLKAHAQLVRMVEFKRKHKK